MKSIHIRPPSVGGYIDFPRLGELPELFDIRYEADDDWEMAFYRSLHDVQGVILIGGGGPRSSPE
jgi:hypothetical protein